ncbi:MAG: ribosomal silencing factor RsfS [Pseudohongiella sp.]|nr:MAG: ribosomal silencing factor RsfS [Pseudohongiella sp.]
MKSAELSELVVEAIDDLKGQSISCIDVKRLTSITDYMVIATGTSSTHLKAMAESVNKAVKESGHKIVGNEGSLASEWVLVDLGGVVVHLMLAPVRQLYNLEELWKFDGASGSDSDSESESPAA